jgi:hypothetical protein
MKLRKVSLKFLVLGYLISVHAANAVHQSNLIDTTSSGNKCVEWVLGYSRESCSLTCSRVSRTCKQDNFNQIVTQQDFYDMVVSSLQLSTGTDTGTAPVFCSQGINVYNFAPSPAAFTYVVCNENGKHEQTYCNYPTSLANLDGDCDAQYIYPPAQRFCPCTVGDCDVPPLRPLLGVTTGCWVTPVSLAP